MLKGWKCLLVCKCLNYEYLNKLLDDYSFMYEYNLCF